MFSCRALNSIRECESQLVEGTAPLIAHILLPFESSDAEGCLNQLGPLDPVSCAPACPSKILVLASFGPL